MVRVDGRHWSVAPPGTCVWPLATGWFCEWQTIVVLLPIWKCASAAGTTAAAMAIYTARA